MAFLTSGYILTNKGRELQARVEKGETLDLTRIKLGQGKVETLTDYAEKTDIVDPVCSLLISKKEVQETSCICTASVSSDGIDTGFNTTELGIFAKDGDDEVLYAVSYEGTSPTYTPGKNDNVSVTSTFEIILSFASVPTVEVTLPADQEKIITLVQNNAAKSVDAAKDAASSKARAEAAATSASTDAKNAANSAAKAKSWANQSSNGQLNANWDETDEKSAAFIQNKPTKVSQFMNDKLVVSSSKPEYIANNGIWIEIEKTT
ncbi:phage tail-collar fiber domain-containing protein [Megasphaera elsdenii]|uniref:phage tail-collar fiber domain-containing protein n=1 Tax=Megasphaera elsdenii TaxID=907 RepID=UPI0033966B49